MCFVIIMTHRSIFIISEYLGGNIYRHRPLWCRLRTWCRSGLGSSHGGLQNSKVIYKYNSTMTSWHRNCFHITGHLWNKSWCSPCNDHDDHVIIRNSRCVFTRCVSYECIFLLNHARRSIVFIVVYRRYCWRNLFTYIIHVASMGIAQLQRNNRERCVIDLCRNHQTLKKVRIVCFGCLFVL